MVRRTLHIRKWCHWWLTACVPVHPHVAPIRCVFDEVTIGGAQVDMGPTAFWALVLKLFLVFSSKRHDWIYHCWNQTITKHFWWAKMGSLLSLVIFFWILGPTRFRARQFKGGTCSPGPPSNTPMVPIIIVWKWLRLYRFDIPLNLPQTFLFLLARSLPP